MAEQRIKAINYNVQEIGKYMKSSKKRFEWVLGLNKKTHTIILDFSFISGKVKVVIDGRTILQNEIPLNTSFQYPFTLDGFALNLIQQGQSCQLRVNNKVFSHLYIQAKTEQEFTKEKGEFSIAPDQQFLNKINTHQKMTLEIGNQKKTKKTRDNDEGGWGAFGGLGAPPGFEPPPGFEGPATTTTTTIVKGNNAAIDFFADDEEAPSQVQQKSEQVNKPSNDFFDVTDSPAPVPTKPAEVNIQNLYSQSGVPPQNQFFTQIHNTLNFGTNQGFNTNIQNQYQTTVGLQQSAFDGINFNGLNQQHESQPLHQTPTTSAQLNFGTNNVPFPQTNISEINFNASNNNNFATNSNINSLYNTNTNNPNNPNNLFATNSNNLYNTNTLGLNNLFATNNININTGVSALQQTNNSGFDYQEPSQQVKKQQADPFGALESIAIQSNFNTTSNVTANSSKNQSSTNMFFTQSPAANTSTSNPTFDLL